MSRVVKLTVAAAVVCAAAWTVLLFGLGNVGLHQSVSMGPQVLMTDYPAVMATAFVVATIASAVGWAILRPDLRGACALVGLILILIAVMSWLVAPILIGELEIEHGGLVFPVLAVLGLLPLGRPWA